MLLLAHLRTIHMLNRTNNIDSIESGIGQGQGAEKNEK